METPTQAPPVDEQLSSAEDLLRGAYDDSERVPGPVEGLTIEDLLNPADDSEDSQADDAQALGDEGQAEDGQDDGVDGQADEDADGQPPKPNPGDGSDTVEITVRGVAHRVPKALAPIMQAMQQDHQAAVAKIHELTGGTAGGQQQQETPEQAKQRIEQAYETLDTELFDLVDGQAGRGLGRKLIEIADARATRAVNQLVTKMLEERLGPIEQTIQLTVGEQRDKAVVGQELIEHLSRLGLPADRLDAGDVLAEMRKLRASADPEISDRELYRDAVETLLLKPASPAKPAKAAAAEQPARRNGTPQISRRPAPNSARPSGGTSQQPPQPARQVIHRNLITQDDM